MCCDGCPASYIGKSVGVTGKKMSDENVRANPIPETPNPNPQTLNPQPPTLNFKRPSFGSTEASNPKP